MFKRLSFLLLIVNFIISTNAMERERFHSDLLGQPPKRACAECASRINFFKNLMGSYEAAWVQDNLVAANLIPGSEAIQNIIKTRLQGMQYDTGSFLRMSIDTLRTDTDNADPFVGNNARFDIISADDPTMKEIDITALQSDPANKDAVFMIASRFHALEAYGNPYWFLGQGNGAVGSGTTIADIKKLNRFNGDTFNCSMLERFAGGTQGENAAISAAPAAIWRMYGEQPFSMVSNLGLHLNSVGFLPWDENRAIINNIIPNANYNIYDNLDSDYLKNVLIGIHENAHVAYGYPSATYATMMSTRNEIISNQTITQVFVSALRFKEEYSRNNQQQVNLGKFFIRVGFEGTLRAAVQQGVRGNLNGRKVHLCMLGAGAFENPKEWCFEALESLVDFIKDKKLHIVMNYFTGNPPERLKNIVRQIGGDIIRYERKIDTSQEDDGICIMQ